MNQTGEGTLTHDEVLGLKASSQVLLPSDTIGRSVVCYGSSHMINSKSEAQLRAAFYLWSVISVNERTQEEGCKCIMILNRSCHDPTVKESLDLVRKALPVRFQAIYMVNCPAAAESPPVDEITFNKSVVPFTKSFLGVTIANQTHVSFAGMGQMLQGSMKSTTLVLKGFRTALAVCRAVNSLQGGKSNGFALSGISQPFQPFEPSGSLTRTFLTYQATSQRLVSN
jgi:hypothetical protein